MTTTIDMVGLIGIESESTTSADTIGIGIGTGIAIHTRILRSQLSTVVKYKKQNNNKIAKVSSHQQTVVVVD